VGQQEEMQAYRLQLVALAVAVAVAVEEVGKQERLATLLAHLHLKEIKVGMVIPQGKITAVVVAEAHMTLAATEHQLMAEMVETEKTHLFLVL
jgi:hypothetical protein